MINFLPFKIDNYFQKLDLKIKKKDFNKRKDVSTVRNAEFNLPLINAKFGDNGIMFFGREEDFDSAEMCIDIVQNGAIATGKVYAQPQKTGVLWDAYLIKPLFNKISVELLLYLTKCLEKSIQEKFNYDNKATWERVKKEFVYLPSSDGKTPDTNYMESHIRELETSHIRKLEKYLLVSGLNDYQLTDEEKFILNEQCNVSQFKINEIFNVLSGRRKLSQLDLIPNGKTPVYSAETTNNGIIGYTNKSADYKVTKETPIYLIFGDHTKTMNIATNDFCVADNVKVLVPSINDIDVILYICAVWKKAIPNLGYARHWSVAKTCILNLPILTGKKLNTEYIKKYITALKKLAIKDVVNYKNFIIEKKYKLIKNEILQQE